VPQAPLQEALEVAVVLLNAYCFGANCVERFVNYQTWSRIPADAFQAYHRAQQPLIQAFVVAPMVVGLALQIGLALWRPSAIDTRVLWVMVVASAVGAASTVMLQLPIHRQFNLTGSSPELLGKLLRTDWIRKAADVVRLAATVIFLHRLLSGC